MLALSLDGDKLFLHQPEDGLAVPVILNFETGFLSVGVPSIEELAHDYAVYDELDDAVRAVGRKHGRLISLARSFSQMYTALFSSQIEAGELTVAQLRNRVVGHYRNLLNQNMMETAGSGLKMNETGIANLQQVLRAD
jgi:hypothetical protein